MNNCYPFSNLPLPYSYEALEPYIDAKTMQLHHNNHLQSYINNLNQAIETCPDLKNKCLPWLICNGDKLPLCVRDKIINNGGGVYNHRFYFNGMKNSENKEPIGMLKKAIECTYGNFENFKSQFTKIALDTFGSGYVWLTLNSLKKLKIMKTCNQMTPICKGCFPIITIDLWEHAYYLKHFNKRLEYIEDWFNVIDWDRAEEIYLCCV